MCPGAGPHSGTSCPSALGALSCRCFARPPPVGPLMTLRAGWRLGQANYMAPSPPRPNNYTATCTERVANCVTSCEGRARAPLELMSFPQSPWGRARARGCGRQALPIPSPPWRPAPGRVAGCAGGREAVIKSQSSPQTCLLLPSLAQSRTWSGTRGLAVSGTIPHMPPSPQGGSGSFRLAFLPLALNGWQSGHGKEYKTRAGKSLTIRAGMNVQDPPVQLPLLIGARNQGAGQGQLAS